MNKVIIIGSGPTGVSAAFPLVKAGVNVLMLEAAEFWDDSYNSTDQSDDNQYIFSSDGKATLQLFRKYASKDFETSPKIRTLASENFLSEYVDALKLKQTNFQAVSGFKLGGLSNLWGASCSCFSIDELDTGIKTTSLNQSYAEIAKRIGVSGDPNDRLSAYLGSHYITDPPVKISENAKFILRKSKSKISKEITFGLPRLALSTVGNDQAQKCIFCKRCFYGCGEEAIYSSKQDLKRLKVYPNFSIELGKRVVNLSPRKKSVLVKTADGDSFNGLQVIIAAGVLSTTRLVLESFNLSDSPIPLLSNPAATFAVFLPERLNSKPSENTIALSQLAFMLHETSQLPPSFGMLYDSDSFPLIDITKHSPFSALGNRFIIGSIMSSMMIGLVYLPAEQRLNTIELEGNGVMRISNESKYDEKKIFKKLKLKIAKSLLSVNAILIPGSFRPLKPGAETHYAGTLKNADLLNDNFSLKLCERIFIADASNMKYLPEKPHTFTAMAIANLIGHDIAKNRS